MMTDRPNILWYCSDQQRFDTIGALGNPSIHTPRLDQFVQKSVALTHVYCQSPICTPSRASFLAGMYPSAVNVNGNGNTDFPRHYQERLVTHRLAKVGYDCGLVGKLHLASPARGQEKRVDDGYRYFQYSHDHRRPNAAGHDYAQWLRSQGANPEVLMDEFRPENYREGAKDKSFGGVYEPTAEQDNIPPHLHQTHWCSDKAIEFIQQDRPANHPWFLSINPFDPHPPFDAPWEYFRRYDPATLPGAHFEDKDMTKQRKLSAAGIDFQSQPQHPEQWNHRKVQASYYAMIEQIDHEFGRLLDFLEETGQRETTLVIFMSDHGESLCDHGLLLKGCRFYEGLVRVPLLISWPGQIQPGVVSEALVELIDLVPTIYDILGIDIPYYIQGKSLLPVLTGQSSAESHRVYVRSECYGALDFPDQTHATMYRDRQWKLVSYHQKNILELYDLENDPWEHHDLSEDSDYQVIKWDLMRKNFDATVYAHPPVPPRAFPF
jgi:arylsulfatase A-like enzyme